MPDLFFYRNQYEIEKDEEERHTKEDEQWVVQGKPESQNSAHAHEPDDCDNQLKTNGGSMEIGLHHILQNIPSSDWAAESAEQTTASIENWGGPVHWN